MRMEEFAERPTIVCGGPIEVQFCPETGLFYVDDPALAFRRAYPPRVMQRAIADAAIAYREFRDGKSAKIIPFPEQAQAS